MLKKLHFVFRFFAGIKLFPKCQNGQVLPLKPARRRLETLQKWDNAKSWPEREMKILSIQKKKWFLQKNKNILKVFWGEIGVIWVWVYSKIKQSENILPRSWSKQIQISEIGEKLKRDQIIKVYSHIYTCCPRCCCKIKEDSVIDKR